MSVTEAILNHLLALQPRRHEHETGTVHPPDPGLPPIIQKGLANGRKKDPEP
jgi:hypothetical protein